ncbi:MAG: hypothetical protein OEL54_01585 [Flavobacteriaceae bacterium]|nr:hypothetical protein [Flavobacteriaceae bacterium]
MNSKVRNVLAIIVGLIIGSFVNMGLIMISSSVIQPPDGADVTTMEGLKASIHLFEPKHFLFPFLAHALGTFVGSLLSAVIAANNKMIFAIVIGVFFLMGGIINSFLLPAPKWFIFTDLILAYIPMAWIGGKIVLRIK